MAPILQTFGANTPVTMTPALTGLTAGAKSLGAEVDNSAGHLGEDIQITGTTGGTEGTVDVYYAGANDTGVYPSEDILGNWTFLMSMDTLATSPDTFRRIEQLPEFYRLMVVNNSDATLGTTTISRQTADLTN